MRVCHHLPSRCHWTIIPEIGRVAERLARRAGWRRNHAEFKQAPSKPRPVRPSKDPRQPCRFLRRFASECASDVQYSSRSRIGSRPAHGSRGSGASGKVAILHLPLGREASDSVNGDRRLALLRSVGIGSVALEEGALSCHSRQTAQNCLKISLVLKLDSRPNASSDRHQSLGEVQLSCG